MLVDELASPPLSDLLDQRRMSYHPDDTSSEEDEDGDEDSDDPDNDLVVEARATQSSLGDSSASEIAGDDELCPEKGERVKVWWAGDGESDCMWYPAEVIRVTANHVHVCYLADNAVEKIHFLEL